MKQIRPIFGLVLAIMGLLLLYQWIGILMIYLMPVPFVIFGYHEGLKKGLWVTIVASMLSLILSDPSYYFLILLGGTVGTVMGGLYHRKSLLPAMVGGFITTLANMILLLLFLKMLLHIDIVESIRNAFVESLQLMNKFGYMNQQGNGYITAMSELVGYILPAMIIFTSFFIVLIVHFLSRLFFKRSHIEMPAFPPIREWMLPKGIFYYYIIVVVLMAIPSMLDIYMIKLTLVNLYPILQFLLMIQGVSFVLFYMNEKNWSGFLRSITLFGFVLLQVTSILPILDFIGLFDLGFNFRKSLHLGADSLYA
ncbi:DUF2232 domain-containing protein [Tepidibacillus marianensis]|uniref:DUF2232 domain-containing protein n=1 Tax=Tepidibacillus marianensis TaxID=3131995 RepID=UPI0030D2A9C1